MVKVESWNGYEIRFVEKDGEWWAVAKGITDALGFSEAKNGTRKIPDQYKGAHKVTTLGGKQSLIVLNEAGIYRMIMRSNKPEAEVFQDWVYHVLKKLREAIGLQSYESLRMMSAENQKKGNAILYGIAGADKSTYCKAASIAGKAMADRMGIGIQKVDEEISKQK
jgi:prophage antirepressor-like protein